MLARVGSSLIRDLIRSYQAIYLCFCKSLHIVLPYKLKFAESQALSCVAYNDFLFIDLSSFYSFITCPFGVV